LFILTIIGSDYTKDSKSYKNVKITFHQSNKSNKIIRIMALFNVDLTFHITFNYSRLYPTFFQFFFM